MQAKISVVYDEGAVPDTALIGAKGSSFFIEADGERTLFGTGLRGRYLRNNMDHMGIDADALDRVIISHADKDEWGAIGDILRFRTKPLPVYAPSEAWGAKTRFGSTGILFSAESAAMGVEQNIEGWIQFSQHVYVSEPFVYRVGKNSGSECVIVVRGSLGPIIVTNCCHPGIEYVFDNVEKKFGRMPVGFIGGLHICKRDDLIPDKIGKFLQDSNVSYVYLNHCTGQHGIGRIRTVLGLDGAHDFYAGMSAQFDLT